MSYLYLIAAVFMNASASIFGTLFNKNNESKADATKFYNFLQLVSVFLIWGILYAFDFSFEWRVLPYSFLFAACFALCNFGMINALKEGPTTLTTLFISLSLLLTTAWGFFFWGAAFTWAVAIGLILVAISITLCLCNGKREEKRISWKWLLFALIAFVSNAGCSIVQRTQQTDFHGEHGNMLMAFATALSALMGFLIYVFSDKRDSVAMLKKSWHFPVFAGGCNVLLNVFVMLLASSPISPSLVYPVIGVGGLAVVTLISLIAFKEKLKWWQWIGIGLGALATVLLSI